MTAPTPSHVLLAVAVDAPFHSGIGHLLSYTWGEALPAGTLVRVPLGQKEVLGIVWDSTPPPLPDGDKTVTLRPLHSVLKGIAPLGTHWLRLVEFAARYYQRSLGEVALAALPPTLRSLSQEQIDRRLRRLRAQPAPVPPTADGHNSPALALMPQQQQAVAQIVESSEQGCFVLHGATGSGKTEVFMQCAQQVLQHDEQAQVLVLVPEINLTPQLQATLQARFAPLLGADCVASLHSGLTPAQRLAHWLAIHQGRARLVLGTRMAIFASIPHLRLLVVDEEHDSSYKQQEGARYHARDLAVWRGRQEEASVILASATPSLESWHNSRPPGTLGPEDAGGHYRRLSMPVRVGEGTLAQLRIVDMRQQPRNPILAPVVVQAIGQRLQQGEQCMVLINRRGYAPVLQCQNCGWKSDCPHCSAHQVLHLSDRSLRCHHCGFATPAPRHCPDCHSPDLAPIGRGTEQVQQAVQDELARLSLPHGRPPVVLRMDADSTRHKGALETQLARIHAGEVDVIVGTQMIAKGHDFRRIGLVAVIQPDGALYAADFRAPERLFALLMQAAGRAGRDAAFAQEQPSPPELWLQTHEPEHPLYRALHRHDFTAFATQQLLERQQADLPPFCHQALLRADARTQEGAQTFLQTVVQQVHEQPLPGAAHVTLYPPVPLAIQRVANVERAQMLLESHSRAALQQFLRALQPLLHASRQREHGLIRWLVDVDPLAI
ncbi:replication restart DNA helicase PriA [Lampropedia hyalina DSM 16112]|jgi:primosomal protein N' (replication factor Y)|uniref:Replication restart protein PriA n=1 Tax=Lampropedia hyalina DSM 16112 TaxID=1122156 RepID=A0A1M5CN92_9BURK|nr:primosomal protein N' [Lampropedia hyalina]SHF56087.1 replication restart DNA helicase PriA [Lampropedia hyalina DSM 16112]